MSIRFRIVGSFVLLILFLIGSELYDKIVINSLIGDAKMINYAGSQRMRTAKLAYLASVYIETRDEAYKKEITKEITKYEEILDGLQQGSEKLELVGVNDMEANAYIGEARTLWTVYKINLGEIIDKKDARSIMLIRELVFPLIEEMNHLTFRLDEVSTSNVEQFRQAKKIALWIALLLGILIAIDIMRAIVRPMNKLLNGMHKVAEGDLHLQMEERGKNEFSLLAASFNDMTNSLNESRNELEKTNKELEDFVYTVSHDLKEPLRGISAFSQFIREDYEEKLDDKGRDYLKRIIKSCSRMRELIDDLLTLSRIGRTKNPFEEVDAKVLVEEVLNRSKHFIDEKKVVINVAEDLPVIYCDKIKMQELFANLISNAIKFIDKSPPVVEIGYEKRSGEDLFFISDNGIGIDKRYFDKIFEIFQRLNLKEDYKGSGAGLTIVKKVVEEHGGRIWVESLVGEGSTFFFTIPKRSNN
ncbi:MAG: type IV pili methyl-accepting chemotaxis transducer N-terminal domain-containing protein [Proteobacteria bacterium]|nr:type IV pili methyl-accepting chemotaxis transducer N-terminal domain-containing protein [Pseudomonadota bacterium]